MISSIVSFFKTLFGIVSLLKEGYYLYEQWQLKKVEKQIKVKIDKVYKITKRLSKVGDADDETIKNIHRNLIAHISSKL